MIRVLVVDLSQYHNVTEADKEPFKCGIRIIGYDQPDSSWPNYYAISYTWGDVNDITTILVDNQEFPVTKSLEKGLQVISRNASRSTINHRVNKMYIWADAICIDQKCNEEKSQQVPQMFWIYESAALVFIWLGEEHEDNALGSLAFPDNTAIERVQQTYLDCSKSEAWRSFFSLLRRPWFRRLWIVEEFVAPKQSALCMYLGAKILFPSQLRKVVDSLYKLYQDNQKSDISRALLQTEDSIDLIETVSSLFSIRDRYYSQNTYQTAIEHLWALILDTVWRPCSQAQDRVYALYGLAFREDNKRFLLKLDYDKPLGSLFTELMEAYIQVTFNLNILGIASGMNSGEIHKLELPSWVPDLSSEKVWLAQPASSIQSLGFGNFHSSLNWPAAARFSEDLKVLWLWGFRVSTIEEVAEWTVSGLNWGAEVYSRILKSWVSFATRTKHDEMDATSQLETLARTITADSWRQKDTLLTSCKDVLLKSMEDAETSKYEDWSLNTQEYLDAVMDACEDRRLYRTVEGEMGLGPSHLKQSDVICVLFGGPTPYVLRKKESENFRFIGETYLHGAMHGETVSKLEAGKYQLQEFGIE